MLIIIIIIISVLALQSSLGRRCGVRTKDIILLSPKGHLLDSKETLGGYDAGTVLIINIIYSHAYIYTLCMYNHKSLLFINNDEITQNTDNMDYWHVPLK